MSDEGTPGDPGETLRQSEESSSASKGISMPAEARQHPDAPRIARYVLSGLLGRGAFAQVWKAWQIRTKKWVALKVFTERAGVNWLFLQREVERLIRLDKHPHIVTLLDADLDGDPPYYTLDLMETGSLDRFVDPQKPASVAETVRWMEQAAGALGYVHSKGLIHCDLKPANILLDEQGRIRVADFGQSRILTESSEALGTLFYMAPEQAVLTRDAARIEPDIRWDIYALGATAYAVLTGKVPYAAESRKALETTSALSERLARYREAVTGGALMSCREATGGRVDRELSAIVAKCMAAEPASRYRNIAELEQDIQDRALGRPVSPLAASAVYRVRCFLRRHSLAAAVCLIAAGLLAASGVKILRQNAGLLKQLALQHVFQAEGFVAEGRYAEAAAFYAKSYAVYPTRVARINSLALLSRLSVPVEIIKTSVRSLSNPGPWSPDGHRVLVMEGRRVWIFDIASKQRVEIDLGEEHRSPRGAIFRPDGESLIVYGFVNKARSASDLPVVVSSNAAYYEIQEKRVSFWSRKRKNIYFALTVDTRSGKIIGEVADIKHELHHGVLSPDGKRIVTMSSISRMTDSKRVTLRDARTWKAIGPPIEPGKKSDGSIIKEGFSPDGKVLYTSNSRFIRLWDGRTGKPLGGPLKGGASGIEFSPDGGKLKVGSTDGFIRVWDVRTRKLVGSAIRVGRRAHNLVFSPDSGKVLIDAGAKLILWDYENAKMLWSRNKKNWIARVLSFSPDGRFILHAKGNFVRVLHASTGDQAGPLLWHDGAIWKAKFDAESKSILTLGSDHLIKVWKVGGDSPVRLHLRHERGIRTVAYSPDGARFLAAYGGNSKEMGKLFGMGFAQVFDAGSGTGIGAPMYHARPVTAAAFSPDGSTVLTGSNNGHARFWQSKTGNPLGDFLSGLSGLVPDVAFTPDGRTAIVPFYLDKKVTLYDVASRKPIIDVKRTSFIGAVAANPAGGTFLISAGEKAWIMKNRTRKETGVVIGHVGNIIAAKYSADGRRVLTASSDGIAKVSDTQSGKSVGHEISRDGGLRQADLSPDGRTVATVVGEANSGRLLDVANLVQLWDVETGSPLGLPFRVAGYSIPLSFSPGGDELLVGGDALRIRDISWLSREATADELLSRTRVVTRRMVDDDGSLQTIPIEEWRKLPERDGAQGGHARAGYSHAALPSLEESLRAAAEQGDGYARLKIAVAYIRKGVGNIEAAEGWKILREVANSEEDTGARRNARASLEARNKLPPPGQKESK